MCEIYDSLQLGIIRKRESGVGNKKRSKIDSRTQAGIFAVLSLSLSRDKPGLRTTLLCLLESRKQRDECGGLNTLA
jgi:hypothetical protein